MKTLNQLKTESIEISAGQPISRSNYVFFADRIIPKNNPKAQIKSGSPEYQVYLDAQHLNTSDWLDMAVFRAALSQTQTTAGREAP